MHSRESGLNFNTETGSVVGIFGSQMSMKKLSIGNIQVFGAVWIKPEVELPKLQEEIDREEDNFQ